MRVFSSAYRYRDAIVSGQKGQSQFWLWLGLLLIGSSFFLRSVDAQDTQVGTTQQVPALACASDNAWLQPTQAQGQPESTVELSALPQGLGDLSCGSFAMPVVANVVQPQIVVHVAQQLEVFDEVEVEPSADAAEATTDADPLPETEEVAVNEPQTTIAISDQDIAVRAASERYESLQADDAVLDGVLDIEVSTDGTTWSQLALLRADQLSETFALALDPSLVTSATDLQVRLRSLAPDLAVYVDAITLNFVVGDDGNSTIAPQKAGEVVESIVVDNDYNAQLKLKVKEEGHGFWQGIASMFQAETEPAVEIDVQVIDVIRGGDVAAEAELVWTSQDFGGFDAWDVVIPAPDTLKPGKKRAIITVTDDQAAQTITQDFQWGVLALNANKSRYALGETGRIDMTVLDDRGATICDAAVHLAVYHGGSKLQEFSTEAGQLQPSETCQDYGPHITPDYSAEVTFDRLGEYHLHLRAETANGVFAVTDTVLVESAPEISVERVGPTRIYPKVGYPMQLQVTSVAGYKGIVREVVPDHFVLSQYGQGTPYASSYVQGTTQHIVWDVDLAPGESTILSYWFDAPDVAPEFYLLGPLTFDAALDLGETRKWQIASDAIGDIAIYREATGNEALAGGATLTANFDTTVRQDAIYTLNGANNAVDLGDNGHYLVMYNASLDEDAGGGRREINADILVNGAPIGYGRSTCYIRNSGGTDECWLNGATILEATAGDDVGYQVRRTDSQGGGNTVRRRANESGLQFLKLDDSWSYARIQEAGGGQAFDSQGFQTVSLDTDDELDAGFSRSGGDITLEAKGHYLVTYNLTYNTTTNVRRAVSARLTVDNQEVPASIVTSYIRGNNNTRENALSYVGIIETYEPNQVLRLEGACTSLECSTLTNAAGETAITIAKLPDNADFVRLTNSTSTQTVDAAADVTFDQQDELDTAGFAHTGGAAPITVATADDYLFTASFFSDRFGSASGARQYPVWRWEVNGATQTVGAFGRYNRGDQGTTGDYSSGSSGGFLGSNLGVSDTVNLLNTDFSTGTDANNTFQANQYGVQGVGLTSLFATIRNTRQEHFRWRDDSAALNAASGFLAVEDSNAIGQGAVGDTYRIRFAAANIRTAAEASARQYQLQFAPKTENHCELVGGWTAIGASSSDAFHTIAVGNFATGDATTALLANSEGYTFIPGEGRDQDDTTGSIGPLGVGQYTEIEYAFTITTDSTEGQTYCFRMYDTAAGSALDSYGRYPEISIASPDSQQLHFRWRDDTTALNTSGGFLAAEDTRIATTTKGDSYRLRLEVANNGTAAERAARTYQLQFADRERFTNCSLVAEGSWQGVGVAADAVDLLEIDNIIDGEVVTPGLLANTETYTFVSGYAHDTSDTTATIGPLQVGEYTELEYSIQVTDQAITGHTYCFRAYDTANSEPLTTYSVFPELIVEGTSVDTGVRGEAGIIDAAADGAWTTITFEQSYVTPVIVGQAVTENDVGPVIVEFRNVTATGAEMRACDTDGGSGLDCEVHASEEIHYIVVDADTTDDYAGIEAGTVTRSGNGQSNITYPSETMTPNPYVFANVQDGDAQPIETRINGVGAANAGLSICDQTAQDTCSGAAPTRTIGWIAIQPLATAAPFNVERSQGTITLDNSFVNAVTYSSAFTEQPVVISEVQTNATTNNVNVDRVLDVTTAGARVGFCEHENNDNCGGSGNETIAYFAVEQGVFGQSSLDLATYRWYDIENANTPTTPKADENTLADGVIGAGAAGWSRLRLGIQVGVADIAASAESIRLQYATRATTCDAVGSWTTLGGVAAGTPWRGLTVGGAPTDGDILTTSLLNAGTNPLQTLEEQNDSVVNPTAINRGERGEWDFAIDENGAATDTYYCFRIVMDTGQVITTSQYPQLYTGANSDPNDPTSLDQVDVTPQTSIGVGSWITDDQVEFRASMSDPDNPNDLQLCVEVQPIGTPFTDTATQCGSAQTYSGTAVNGKVVVTGLADGTSYHWQAQVIDDFGGSSAWVSFGGNLETASDFGIDTTAPTGGTVFDGATIGVDLDYNNGALDTLDANWSGVDANASGLQLYEYAIGTTPGGVDVLGWTANGTLTTATATSLTLDTQSIYYISIRTTDNAGNQAIITSDGILVAPALTFSSDTSVVGIDFGELTSANSYTATQNTVLTTTTNAYNGYVVRAYATQELTNINTTMFGMFNGGSYAAPDEWMAGDTGWGYTSSDTTIQGSNIFSPATCAGGGSPPCYAPFSLIAPGDIIADQTATISGTPVNEAYIITHRVTTNASQEYGTYNSEVIYSATASY